MKSSNADERHKRENGFMSNSPFHKDFEFSGGIVTGQTHTAYAPTLIRRGLEQNPFN